MRTQSAPSSVCGVQYDWLTYLIAYGIAAIVFFALSFLWIGFIVWSAKVWWNHLGKKKDQYLHTTTTTRTIRFFCTDWCTPDPMLASLFAGELARIKQDQRELARINQDCFR